jgi:hypothetical protein
MPNTLNRNKIQIKLKPNLYYTQLPKAQRDKSLLGPGPIDIAPFQIKKVEIFKSYATHVTDVVLHLDNIDPSIAAQWSENKYIAHLIISPDMVGDTGTGIDNFFMVHSLTQKPTPEAERMYSTIPTANLTVILKSITRARLEKENNFTFELGGKKGQGAAGVGKSPIQFLESDLMKLYARNYMEAGEETVNPWTMTYCDRTEPTHQIRTTPPDGFKMITDNN